MDRPDPRLEATLMVAPIGSQSYGRGGHGNVRGGLTREGPTSTQSPEGDANEDSPKSPTGARKIILMWSNIKDKVPTEDPEIKAKRRRKKERTTRVGPSHSDSSFTSKSAGTSQEPNYRKSRESQGSLDNNSGKPPDPTTAALTVAGKSIGRRRMDFKWNTNQGDRPLPPTPNDSYQERGDGKGQEGSVGDGSEDSSEGNEEDTTDDEEKEADGFNLVGGHDYSNIPEHLNEPGFTPWGTYDQPYRKDKRSRARHGALSRGSNAASNLPNNPPNIPYPNHSSYPDTEMTDYSRPLSQVSRVVEPPRSPPSQFRSPSPPQSEQFPTATPLPHYSLCESTNGSTGVDSSRSLPTTTPIVPTNSSPSFPTTIVNPLRPDTVQENESHDSFHLGGFASSHRWQQERALERNNSNYSTTLPRDEGSIRHTNVRAYTNLSSNYVSTSTALCASTTVRSISASTITEDVETATMDTTADINRPTTTPSTCSVAVETSPPTTSSHSQMAPPISIKYVQSSHMTTLDHQSASTSASPITIAVTPPTENSHPYDPSEQPTLSNATSPFNRVMSDHPSNAPIQKNPLIPSNSPDKYEIDRTMVFATAVGVLLVLFLTWEKAVLILLLPIALTSLKSLYKSQYPTDVPKTERIDHGRRSRG